MSDQSKRSMAFRFFILGVLVLILAHKCFGLIGTTKGTTTKSSLERYRMLTSLLGQKLQMFERQLLLTPDTNLEDKLKIQEYCKSYEGTIKALILESGRSLTTVNPLPEMISTYMPATCEQVRNDLFGNGTAEEMFNLIIDAQDNIREALEIIFDKTNPTEEVIRSVMPHLLNLTDWDVKLKTMSAVIGAYIESKGGVSRMTLNDFAVITPEIMFAIPGHYYRDLPVDVLNNILDLLYNCTVFVMDLQKDDQDFKMDPANSFRDEISVDQGKNSTFQEQPFPMQNFTDEHEICMRINFFRLYEFTVNMEDAIRGFCDSLFNKYRDIVNMRTFRRLLFMMFCAPVRTCQAVPNNFVQDNIDQLRELPWPCNPLMTKQDLKRQMIKRTFSSAETCGRIFAEKAVTDGKDALDIKTEVDWKRMGRLSSCLSDDYLFKAAQVLNCSMVADALDEGILSMKVADAVKQRCFEAPNDPTHVTCFDLKEMGGFISTLSARFLEGIPRNETCEPSCVQFLKDSLALPVNMKKSFLRQCFGGDGVVLDSATLKELGGDIAKLPMKKLGEIPGRDILANFQAIKDTIDLDMTNKGNKAAVLTRLAEKIMEAGGIKELAKHAEFMQTISVRELKSTITDVVKDLGLDDPQFVPNFPDSQNKFLMKKMLDEKPADNFTVEDLRSMKSLVKGFLSHDIQNLGSSDLMEKAVVLCEQTNWPVQSLKTINRFLIKGELSDRSRTQPFSKLTPVDVSMLGCECLINFEPLELLKMTRETCMSVCNLVGTCDNFRCFNPLHRRNFASACLQCMGTVGRRPLSAENADRLGSNIIQNLSPVQLNTLISTEVVQTRQSYFTNACLVPDQMSVLGRKIIGALGSTSTWNLNTVSNVGSNIQFLTPSEQLLIDKTLIYDILENISAEINPTSEETLRLRECCERWLSPEDKTKIDEARRSVGVTFKDAIVYKLRLSNPPKRKRAAVSFTCAHIQAMGEAFATQATIDEVNAIEDSEFTSCLQMIGSMTGWSAGLLAALLAKSEQILGDVCNMTTDEFVSLNYITTALSAEDIGCLPLDADDIVAALGHFSTWSNSQLSSLASRYMTIRSLTNLENVTAAEITSLGHILCGFSSNILISISPSVIGASGQAIGKLDQCPTAQLQTIKQLATQISAYGPVANWTAADVSELGIILAGLIGEEIQQLNSAAIEGIAANIIPKIPPDVLSVKDVILKILKLFEAEKENPIKYRAFPVKRLSKALGISQTYLYHLKQEDEKEAVNNVVDYMHQQSKKKHNFHRRKLDDFDEDLVTRTVHDLYMQGKPVTLTKLQIVLREKGVDVSQTTVRKVLQRHGFRYRRNVTGRRFMVERDEVIAQRHAYLRKIKKLREQGCHIVYLDETWINTHHTVKGGWVEENQASTSTLEPFCKSTGRFVPSGKGSRLIIADAGSSQMGLVPGCSLVFESKTNKSDYHDEMNAECFTEWFRDTLIPKLDRSSVIVMDNASYHSQLDPQSKAPSSSSRKAEVQAWLDRCGVHYDHEMCKAELLGLVKINKPNPRYIIDELASLHGHEVLCLPPRHCELNPIELVWADVKGYVARNNSAFKKDTIITLYSQARQRIDRVQWQKVESHVTREVEEKFWEVDGIKENEVDPVIIELNYSDNDDTDSEDSFDSGDEKLTDDDDLSDAISDDSNDHDIPCNICQQKEPPGLSARIRNVSWHECELCEKWVHDKCCKESKNKSLCDRCWAIIHNRSFET